jgi:UDP-N-acetylmuramoyl-tripeptide--D-alanyl-D-alanine ligase
VKRRLKRFWGKHVPLAWRFRVLSFLAALRRYQRPHATFIAVTGSCGKGTTIALAAAMLSTAGKCQVGVGPRRTLVPDTIIGVKPSTRFCIQELHASTPGNVAKYLRLLKPQIGVVTTIGSDHYREYRSLEAIAREKGLLVERLPPSGVAILNIDDPLVHGMAKRGRARLMTFGRSPQADVRAVEVSGVWPNRLSMQVAHGHEIAQVETKFVGELWVPSVLAAIALGIACGLDLKTCTEAVKRVKPLFGRYSVHTRSDGASYVLDSYKAPYWTIAEGLTFMRQAAAPRKTVVFGNISHHPGKGGHTYRSVAKDALAVADRVVFVGPNAAHIDKLQGKEREKLFGFQTSYEASAFLSSDPTPGELIYVKAGIRDHLERVMLSELDKVVCWRERCGRFTPCMDCSWYRRPKKPPLGLGQAVPAAHPL